MADEREQVEKVIRDFLASVQLELKMYLQANDRNATGRTSNSLQLKNVTEKGGSLVGNGNVFETFLGRGPGRMPPLQDILNWCISRGIPRSAAWPIAVKIGKEGTRLYRELRSIGFQNNAISLATRKEIVDRALADIATIYRRKIITDLNKSIATINS